MAAIIIIESNLYDSRFFKDLDYFISKNDFEILSEKPRVYFNRRQMPPSVVQNLIFQIRKIKESNRNISRIYYSAGLQIR